MEWILKLAAVGVEGPFVDVMEISKPDDLGDIANLGLTLAEAKQLLARVQCEISTAQASKHAVRRPACPCREDDVDRDRGAPHGAAPPTPPGIRVRTTAVRPD